MMPIISLKILLVFPSFLVKMVQKLVSRSGRKRFVARHGGWLSAFLFHLHFQQSLILRTSLLLTSDIGQSGTSSFVTIVFIPSFSGILINCEPKFANLSAFPQKYCLETLLSGECRLQIEYKKRQNYGLESNKKVGKYVQSKPYNAGLLQRNILFQIQRV